MKKYFIACSLLTLFSAVGAMEREKTSNFVIMVGGLQGFVSRHPYKEHETYNTFVQVDLNRTNAPKWFFKIYETDIQYKAHLDKNYSSPLSNMSYYLKLDFVNYLRKLRDVYAAPEFVETLKDLQKYTQENREFLVKGLIALKNENESEEVVRNSITYIATFLDTDITSVDDAQKIWSDLKVNIKPYEEAVRHKISTDKEVGSYFKRLIKNIAILGACVQAQQKKDTCCAQ